MNPKDCIRSLKQGFSTKRDQILNILGFVNYKASQLCCCIAKAATVNKQMNKCVCVPIKLSTIGREPDTASRSWLANP